MKRLILCMVLAFSSSAFAAKKVALVKLIRGKAVATISGHASTLKVDDWVDDGSVVKTEEKSFVKLIFLDKSTMNVGPSSEMKIEKFNGKDAGVIDLVNGKIRSQVTKDYLQIKDKDKSKLFIKTNNAVMGVRGTDFLISTNGVNTATVLFEGEVAFNQLSNPETTNTSILEQAVDNGVRIVPGEFSVVDHGQIPTVPSLLNVGQLEKLEKNENFTDGNRAPAEAPSNTRSIVPPGLTGEIVSNASGTIKAEVASIIEVASPVSPASQGNASGFEDGDKIKPANGSFVHIETGVIVPPPSGSVLDKNTNTYIAVTGAGTVAQDGSYLPPKDVTITSAGQILIKVTDSNGVIQQKEIPKLSPVVVSVPVVNTSPNNLSDASGRSPASVGMAPPNTFGNPSNFPGGTRIEAGPGSIFSGGVIGNTQLPPPSAGTNPFTNPAELSNPSNSGNFNINIQKN